MQLSSFRVLEIGFLWTSIYACVCPFTDFALAVSSELESVLRLETVNYFVTRRPWLGMCHIPIYIL